MYTSVVMRYKKRMKPKKTQRSLFLSPLFQRQSRLFITLATFSLLAVTALTVVFVQSVQDTRQYANETSENSFTFSAAGDYNYRSNFKQNINTLKEKINPDFTIALGDFAYAPEREKEWCKKFTQAIAKVVLITGNHDTGGEGKGGEINKYIRYCNVPVKNKSGQYGKQYYFDYPEEKPLARFILLSPGLIGTVRNTYHKNAGGYNFTEKAIDDARAKNIPWVIVGFHKTCIDASFEGSCEIEKDLVNLLIDKKVDLVLQGHIHDYQRTKQLTCVKIDKFDPDCVVDDDNELVKGAGTVMQILGTGGRLLGSGKINKNDKEIQYFANTSDKNFGSGVYTVTPTLLTFNFVSSKGPVFNETFTIATTENTITPSPPFQPSTDETDNVQSPYDNDEEYAQEEENEDPPEADQAELRRAQKEQKQRAEKEDKERDERRKKEKEKEDRNREKKPLIQRLKELAQPRR